MGLIKKDKNLGRNPRVEYKKQQSYHYSSRRSLGDKGFDRRSVTLDDGVQKEEKRSFVQVLPNLIAVGLVTYGVFYLLTLSTNPYIVVVNDNAKTQLIDKDALKLKAKDLLGKSLQNRFKPTFNEEKVANQLQQLSPEIISAQININLLRHNPRITVVFSEPSLVLASSGKLYVLGSDGRALADVTSDDQGFNTDTLPLVQDESGVSIELGKIALPSDQVSYIKEVNYQAEQAKLKIVSMAIKPGGFELDVKYAKSDYFVKYSLFEDARKSSGVFLATVAELGKDGRVPSEYIDVRVPERAYVK